MPKLPVQLVYVLIALLLIALLPLPYGYYQLLRLVAFVGFGWAAIATWQNGLIGLSVAAGIVALLYNPILPVHLTKEFWIVINLASAGFLFYMSTALEELPESTTESSE